MVVPRVAAGGCGAGKSSRGTVEQMVLVPPFRVHGDAAATWSVVHAPIIPLRYCKYNRVRRNDDERFACFAFNVDDIDVNSTFTSLYSY